MIRAIVAVLFCAVLSSCYTSCVGYKYEDCGSNLGKFTDVSVSGCDTSMHDCPLKRGANATISITFIPDADISEVKLSVFGVISGMDIPFPMNNADVCKDSKSGVQCPLKKNQEYHYTTTMFVQKMFPKVAVLIKWKLEDPKSGDDIVCILFPAKLI